LEFIEVAAGFVVLGFLDVILELSEEGVFLDLVAFLDMECGDAVGGAGEHFDFGLGFEVGFGADDGLDEAALEREDLDEDGGVRRVGFLCLGAGEWGFEAAGGEDGGGGGDPATRVCQAC
jgi:hypothetical protein